MNNVDKDFEQYVQKELQEKAAIERVIWELCESLIGDPCLEENSMAQQLLSELKPQDILSCVDTIVIVIKTLFHALEAIARETKFSPPSQFAEENQRLKETVRKLIREKEVLERMIEGGKHHSL